MVRSCSGHNFTVTSEKSLSGHYPASYTPPLLLDLMSDDLKVGKLGLHWVLLASPPENLPSFITWYLYLPYFYDYLNFIIN